MTTVKLAASCPYEIGETITVGREIHPPELAFMVRDEEHTITDIVCQYSARDERAVFLYELDGRGPLVQIQEPRRKRKKGRT